MINYRLRAYVERDRHRVGGWRWQLYKAYDNGTKELSTAGSSPSKRRAKKEAREALIAAMWRLDAIIDPQREEVR